MEDPFDTSLHIFHHLTKDRGIKWMRVMNLKDNRFKRLKIMKSLLDFLLIFYVQQGTIEEISVRIIHQ